MFSDDDEVDEDDLMENINCFTGIFPSPNLSPAKAKPLSKHDLSASHNS